MTETQKLDINLGNGKRFNDSDFSIFDLSLPLEKNIGLILLKACLVDSLDEMFNERQNYTLYADGLDLRSFENECPEKVQDALKTKGAVLELKKYEGE